MTLALFSMGVSLVGMAFLFFHKLSEMHREAPVFSESLRARADSLVSKHKNTLVEAVRAINKKNMIRLLVPITIFFIRVSRGVESFLRRRLKTFIDMIHGKGAIKNKGSVSFFLKNISEYKESLKKD